MMPKYLSKDAKGRFIRKMRNMDGVNKCEYCHLPLTSTTRTIDHLLPLSRGGVNAQTNLVLCCKTCNNAKADLTLAEFVVFVSLNGGIERTKEIFGKGAHSRARQVQEIVA